MTRAWAASVAAAALVAPALANADPVEDAYAKFRAQDYRATYDLLQPYRVSRGASLRVDYMMAASACTFASRAASTWGLRELRLLPQRYALTADQKASIDRRAQACEPVAAARLAPAGSAGVGGTFRPPFDTQSDLKRAAEEIRKFEGEPPILERPVKSDSNILGDATQIEKDVRERRISREVESRVRQQERQ